MQERAQAMLEAGEGAVNGGAEGGSPWGQPAPGGQGCGEGGWGKHPGAVCGW